MFLNILEGIFKAVSCIVSAFFLSNTDLSSKGLYDDDEHMTPNQAEEFENGEMPIKTFINKY